MLCLFQVEMLSWGYLFHRAYTLQINLFPLVSRVPTASTDNRHTENESAVSISMEEIKLTGRIMLNIWRLMRHEVYSTHMHAVTLTGLSCITSLNLVTCRQALLLPFSVRDK
jgi:DNA polymerase elongation subunit (family B)